MKKFLTFLFALTAICCLFSVSASAENEIGTPDYTYYVVNEGSEVQASLEADGKETVVLSEIYALTNAYTEDDWIAQFNSGDHIELIFAETIVESLSDYEGILLNKAITLTVRYNGFSHLITSKNRENVFVLRHGNASLNLIGTSNAFNEDGTFKTSFIYDPTNLSRNEVQIHHGKVYAWVFDGNVYVENVTTNTGEEFVYVTDDDKTSDTDPGAVNTYEFVSSSFTGNIPIGLLGQGSAQKIVKMSNCYCTKLKPYTIVNGTEFNNCKIDTFEMDCWAVSNQMAVFKNCSLNKITTASGRTHLTFIDCDFNISSLSLGSDGGGKCYALVYTTPTCETDGTLNIYRNGSGTTPVTDDSKYPYSMVEEYNNANKAYGHSFTDWSFAFNGEKYLSLCSAERSCSICNSLESEEIDPIFESLGYSISEFADARGRYYITTGFSVDTSALARYETLFSSCISYGIAVGAVERIGSGTAPLDENGNKITGVISFLASEDRSFLHFNLCVGMTETHFDSSLLMTAYIIEDTEDAKTISYMQDGKITDSDSFIYVAYNDYVA